MVAAKAILLSIIGAVIGVVGGFVLGVAVYIVVGIVAWDSSTGSQAGTAVWVLCVLAGAGIGLAIPLMTEAERQKADQNAIDSRRSSLSFLLSTARDDFRSSPALVSAAEEHLDRAEREFADGVFAPFWDQIEGAANSLAAYHQRVQRIERSATEYQQLASSLPVSVPPFSLPTGQLPDARPTATRLAALVRKAQKNFQFATIYEQRKTNRILVEGFGTLASAIYSLGDMISGALSDLSNTLHVSLDRIVETAGADAAARRRFERKTLRKQDEQSQMLDNIQRRRKPLL